MKNAMKHRGKASSNNIANPTVQLIAVTALALTTLVSLTLVVSIMQSLIG